MKFLGFAVLSAVLLSISWPTGGVPFFIFIAFLPLLWAENELSKSELKRKGVLFFGLSYLTFFLWNIATTGWLYNSKNPDGSPALLAVAIPVLANSLLMSLAIFPYHFAKKRKGLSFGLLMFVVSWMSFEKFHLEWEFSWPWLNLGNVFAEYPKIIQWYDTLGATGGSFWILIVNALIFRVIVHLKNQKNEKYKLTLNLGLILALIFVPMLISWAKYQQFDEKPIGKVKVMMLQPDLDPYTEKYQKDSLQIVQELLDLTKTSDEKIDYYLAPETSFPGTGGLSESGFHHSQSIGLVNEFLASRTQSIFVGGVSSYKIYRDEAEKTPTAYHYPQYNIWMDNYNSALQIIPNQMIKVYHKGKLVPGVEIFPYMNVLKPILGDAMLNFGGTMASLGIDKERIAFENIHNKGSIAPIICYESVYGEYTTEYVQKGANFLGIMTNDSWWGVSEGHRQLLAYARLRAIETRREVARAANSGISAHIDAKGEIIAQTNYGEKSTLIADIQLYNTETIYTKIGDFLSKICMIIFVILGVFLLFSKNNLKLK